MNKAISRSLDKVLIQSQSGWFADNLWPVVTGLILVPVLYEFKGSQGPFLKLGQNIGLLVGAVVWSFASDVWGRR